MPKTIVNAYDDYENEKNMFQILLNSFVNKIKLTHSTKDCYECVTCRGDRFVEGGIHKQKDIQYMFHGKRKGTKRDAMIYQTLCKQYILPHVYFMSINIKYLWMICTFFL